MSGGSLCARPLDRRSLLGAALGLGLLAPALAGCSSPFDQIERVIGLKRAPLYVLTGYKSTSSGFSVGTSDVTVDLTLDEHGNVMQRTTDFTDPEGTEDDSGGIQRMLSTYTRDENGWVTSVESTYTLTTAGGSSSSSTSRKDSQRSTTDSSSSDVTYEFNGDGQPCRLTHTTYGNANDQDGTSSETTYEYDDGVITKVTNTSGSSSDESGQSRSVTDYNEQGFPTRSKYTFTRRKGSGSTSLSTYTYQMDDDGVITGAHVELTSDTSGSSPSTPSPSAYEDAYTYDDNGNLVQCERTAEMDVDVYGTVDTGAKRRPVTRTTSTTYTYTLIDDPSPAAVFDSLLVTV